MSDTTTYPIPQWMLDKTHSGMAIVAIAGGQVVALRNLRQVAPKLDEALGEGGIPADEIVPEWMESPAGRSVVDELATLGEVKVGIYRTGSASFRAF